MTSNESRIARLRGALFAEEPGARGIERMARNLSCEKIKAITVAGIKPSTAVEKIFKEPSEEGISPFALSAGNKFEQTLFENGAAAILKLYRDAGRLGLTECKVEDLSEIYPVRPGIYPEKQINLKRRENLTMAFLRRKASGDRSAPNIIIKPRILITLAGISHAIEPDLLTAGDDDLYYRPVEIKSYANRGGKTDPADIRSACRQAAVGYVALVEFEKSAGFFRPNSEPPICDLILHKLGSYAPTLTSMTIESEADSIRRVIKESRNLLNDLEILLRSIGDGATLSDPAVLDAIPNNYLPACKEHCSLAKRCRKQARQEGNPVLIGIRGRQALAGAGSIGRALELLKGVGRPAVGSEIEIQKQLQESSRTLREVLYGT